MSADCGWSGLTDLLSSPLACPAAGLATFEIYRFKFLSKDRQLFFNPKIPDPAQLQKGQFIPIFNSKLHLICIKSPNSAPVANRRPHTTTTTTTADEWGIIFYHV
jgi:hypothetical protein